MTDLFVLWKNSVECIVLHVPSIFFPSAFFYDDCFFLFASFLIKFHDQMHEFVTHRRGYFMHGRKMIKKSEITCSKLLVQSKQLLIVRRTWNKKGFTYNENEECLLTRIHIGLLWLRDNWTWLKSLWVFVHRTARLTCWFVRIFLKNFLANHQKIRKKN